MSTVETKAEIQEEQKNRKNSLIITFFIMAGIIALLFLVVWRADNIAEELEGGGGVAVSLGEPDAGGPSDAPSITQSKSSTAQEQVDDPIVSQDDPDAVAIKKSDKKKKDPSPKPDPKPTLDNDLSDILGGLSGRKTAGTGTGTTPGNTGQKDGSTGGKGTGGTGTKGTGGGAGAGNGVGISDYSLGSRKIVSAPKNDDEFNVNGKVIVEIWVDRTGKVVRTEIGRGSSPSPQLQNLAEKLAMKTQFQASFADDDLKKGTITFNFKI